MCRTSDFPPYEDSFPPEPPMWPETSGVILIDRPLRNIQIMLHDAWGNPLVTPTDGHSAWSCNDRDCLIHPASLYGPDSNGGGTFTSENEWERLAQQQEQILP